MLWVFNFQRHFVYVIAPILSFDILPLEFYKTKKRGSELLPSNAQAPEHSTVAVARARAAFSAAIAVVFDPQPGPQYGRKS